VTEKVLVRDRPTARVLLINKLDQVFLILTHFDPELGLPPRWLTPGGGIDAGETIPGAALRELFEETGLRLTESDLGELWWQTTGRWDWADGIHYQTYTDSFYLVRIEDFILDDSGWTTDEHRDVLEWRWWSVSELIASGESVGPHGLADHLGLHFSS
jgi:8-oxo-dGTP pyrophosphatase MutT (NUDIX family)